MAAIAETQPETGIDLAGLKAKYKAATNTAAEYERMLKERREVLDAQIRRLQKEFNEANAELINDANSTALEAAEYDQSLRNAALDHYKKTGLKTLDENLSVRVSTRLEYDNAEAVTWASTNAPMLIVRTVDKKKFESIVEDMPLDFVTRHDTPTAVIKGLK